MKNIGKLASWLILALNFFFIAGFLLAAYSPYINPVEHPLRACMGLIFPVFLLMNIAFCVFWLIFKTKYTLFSLVTLIICFPAIRTYIPFNFRSDNIPQENIKVLSYNVMGFSDLTKKANHNAILNYIAQSHADIICMQEYATSENKNNLTQSAIQATLKEYPYYSIERIGNGLNALACYSKYPIISARRVNYKSSYNGSVLYEIVVRGDTVTVINNHLESNKLTREDRKIYEDMITSPETDKVKSGVKYLVNKLGEAMSIRSMQADTIAKEIKQSPNPYVIVCGDFNDSPISYTNRVISQGMDDAFVKSGRGVGVSYNQNRFYFRIDNIIISKNLKAYNCTVDRSIAVSDHYPIWCYIAKR